MADIDRAYESLQAVLAKWDDAEKQVGILQDSLHSALVLFQAGETDRLALLAAELELASAERTRLDVLVEAQQAINALEEGLRYPIVSILNTKLMLKAQDPPLTLPFTKVGNTQ